MEVVDDKATAQADACNFFDPVNIGRRTGREVLSVSAAEVLQHFANTGRLSGARLSFNDHGLSRMPNIEEDLLEVWRPDKGELRKPLRDENLFKQLAHVPTPSSGVPRLLDVKGSSNRRTSSSASSRTTRSRHRRWCRGRVRTAADPKDRTRSGLRRTVGDGSGACLGARGAGAFKRTTSGPAAQMAPVGAMGKIRGV